MSFTAIHIQAMTPFAVMYNMYNVNNVLCRNHITPITQLRNLLVCPNFEQWLKIVLVLPLDTYIFLSTEGIVFSQN